ncbi:MAG TPA: outer membrane lipid asymmetry maintenance protein MlaD [Polyangia bacterium]|nr:outer membrane lipid asymmetry maintenance protein MlaD [Polyangia bacterium]
MFDYTKAEILTGAFLMLGLAVLGYLSVSIGGLRLLPQDAYRVSARFSNVGDLKVRAPVKIAGVTVGRVESIELADYYGQTQLSVGRGVALPRDTIASVATAGLLGEAYVALSPGGAEANLRDGDRITHTEPAFNMADIIGRTAFGAAGAPSASDKDKEKDQDNEREKAP